MEARPRPVKVVVLDIEGTVCPISFVKEVLYPYALSALPSTLSQHWSDPAFHRTYLDPFPHEHKHTPAALIAHVHDLTARDVKAPYLKALQGRLWQAGYASGQLTCPLFADVAPCLRRWREERGATLVIYSSGSVAAQKMLFRYTNTGTSAGNDGGADLRGWLSGYFDTVSAGSKVESGSYGRIAEAVGRQMMGAGGGMEGEGKGEVEIGAFLFLSDNVAEVDAAIEAGMQAVVVVREGNKELSEEEVVTHDVVRSFEEIRLG